jgi:hypothetical protein
MERIAMAIKTNELVLTPAGLMGAVVVVGVLVVVAP